MTLILSNDDISSLLTMSECIDTLEQAYGELAVGRGVTRTRSDTFAPTMRPDALYSLKTMDGIIPKFGVGAVRINSDIVTWPKSGSTMRRVKVPSAPNQRYVGLVLLFSCETGEPLAIFPDGVIQRMRVGAANGLGAKYLSRDNAESIGILGSGWQAGTQLTAACSVRNIKAVKCFSPNVVNREVFTREMSEMLGIPVESVDTPEAAVRGADIVMCATNAIENVFFAHWIEPGMHLSSIKRPEIAVDAIRHADLVVLHTNAPTPIHTTTRDLVIPEKSEGRGWEVADEVDFSTLPTLPDLIAGKTPSRGNDGEVTCFLNNLGLGYQFAAVGALVYSKARELNVGHDLPTDWFTEDVHP